MIPQQKQKLQDHTETYKTHRNYKTTQKNNYI